MDKIRDAYATLGLKEKEVKIMLALSAMPHLSESGVARLTKLPRTTIIPLLWKLRDRKLVQEIRILGRKRWKIEDFKIVREKLLDAYRAFGGKFPPKEDPPLAGKEGQ